MNPAIPAAQLVENFPFIIWTARPDGAIDYYNRRWFEYTGSKKKPQRWELLVHPDDRPTFVTRWSEAIKNGAGYQSEYRLRRADGAYRWHVGHAVPVRKGTEILKWFGTTCEIEALKQADLTLTQYRQLLNQRLESERAAREEAERVNRSKDEFLATLSHELRTPLNAILGWAQLLRGGTPDPARVAHGIEVIERNAMRQARLIEDILDLSRIIAGKLHLQMIDLDMRPIVESAIDAIRPTALANGIDLSVQIPDAVPILLGDAHRLEQVVWNLLANSLKFTPRGGQLHISMETDATSLTLRVKDSGQGIPPSVLPYVFERFWQAADGMARPRGGLGLGLAIVSHLVHVHGGSVLAESEGIGKGACFTVSLPLPAEAERRAEPLWAVPARTSGFEEDHATRIDKLDGVGVLLVEDEADTREVIRMALEARGAKVWVAETADEGVLKWRAHRPKVVVSDIGLPGQDGCQLIRNLRVLLDGDEQLAAVAISARATEEDARRSLSAGFQYHLPKPVELDALASMISRLVD